MPNKEIQDLHDAIRKIRDQFGDDKCHMDWHALFAMLPEGYTPPKQDIAVQLKDCERYLQCQAAGTEYVPPPRWVVGEPDEEGYWIRQFENGAKQIVHESNRDLFAGHAKYSFGPIPEEP